MWLINVHTLKLESIADPETYRYVILSHTWEEDEVSYQEFVYGFDVATKKKGFGKILKTCELAREKGIPYAWVDTCCIDKKSSAELSEAINSMFAWYSKSSMCYAYLSDVPGGDPWTESRWFTRGWTLQELIAPEELEFFDKDWQALGSKQFWRHSLKQRTNIDLKILKTGRGLRSVPVGRRMSWASRRQTTRLEDMAYCLLGIFNVNMPLIYGEGDNAFLRLQLEIAKEINDLSLFAWTAQMEYRYDLRPVVMRNSIYQEFRGILARSPGEFSGCSNIMKCDDELSGMTVHGNVGFSMTNNGVLMETVFGCQGDNYVLSLDYGYCGGNDMRNADGGDNEDVNNSDDVSESQIGILLLKTPRGFVRENPHQILTEANMENPLPRESVYILRDVDAAESELLENHLSNSAKFEFDELPSGWRIEKVSATPPKFWDPIASRLFVMRSSNSTFVACLRYYLSHGDGCTSEIVIICKRDGFHSFWVGCVDSGFSNGQFATIDTRKGLRQFVDLAMPPSSEHRYANIGIHDGVRGAKGMTKSEWVSIKTSYANRGLNVQFRTPNGQELEIAPNGRRVLIKVREI